MLRHYDCCFNRSRLDEGKFLRRVHGMRRPEIILLPNGKTGIRGTELNQHEPLHHTVHFAEKLNVEWTTRFSPRSQFTHHLTFMTELSLFKRN